VKTLIENYRIYPGDHCGSVAMRGLLNHYCDLELPEPVLFGLGAGLESIYLAVPGMSPGVMVVGRTATMEADLADALGVDYRERPEEDDEKAWQIVRDEVLAGRPTMLSGDIFYLDYREYKVHFPGHRFVLLGFDDEREVAFIADRINDTPEACSYGALFRSRNPPEGISTHNLWGRFHGRDVKNDLTAATRGALETCTRRMLGEQTAPAGSLSGFGDADTPRGLAAVEHLARELPGLGAREDALEIASFNGSCIEKFGNGGGNFRRMYAAFLEWARERDPAAVPAEAPARAVQAADGWTALAQQLWAAADGGDTWREAADTAARIARGERALFESLAEAQARL
jgi:hypothetical protein